jgi:hypothetical protein
MATLSMEGFVRILQNHKTFNAICDEVSRKLGKWNADGSPKDGDKGDNATLQNYVAIKIQGARREVKEAGLDVQSVPFLFPEGMPSGEGRSKRDPASFWAALGAKESESAE